MDMTTILTIIGALGGFEGAKWAITSFVNRRTNARKEEAEADSAEFNILKETTEFLQAQLQAKEERFAEQTNMVRSQTDEILRLTKEKGALELELQKYRCVVQKCPKREPQNGY